MIPMLFENPSLIFHFSNIIFQSKWDHLSLLQVLSKHGSSVIKILVLIYLFPQVLSGKAFRHFRYDFFHSHELIPFILKCQAELYFFP